MLFRSLGFQAVSAGGSFHNGKIRAAFGSPVPLLRSPLSHGRRVCLNIRQTGHRHSHGGGAAAVTADVIPALRPAGPGLFALVEIDHVRQTAGKDLPAVLFHHVGDSRAALRNLRQGAEGNRLRRGLAGQLNGGLQLGLAPSLGSGFRPAPCRPPGAGRPCRIPGLEDIMKNKKNIILAVVICVVLFAAGIGIGLGIPSIKKSIDKKEVTEENVLDYIDIGDYKSLDVSIGVTKEDIEMEIDDLREQNTIYEQLEGTVADGDMVYADITGYVDGDRKSVV